MAGIGNKRGMAIFEYAAMAGIFTLAVVGTQVYVLRAMQGRVKANTDSIGPQYSYAHSNYNYHQVGYSLRRETTEINGDSRSELLEHEINAKTNYVDDFSGKGLSGDSAERLGDG